MQEELYEKIQNRNPYQVNLLLTVIDGPAEGEKALLANGILLWTSKKDGFLESQAIQFADWKLTGEDTIDGNRIFAECIGSDKELVICGGGHVSEPIVTMGLMLGFRVHVIEDRPKFADNIRRLGAVSVTCNSFEHGLDEVKGNENTFFVIVTRGHRYDLLCLSKIIQKPNAYIGMIGSKRRVAMVKDILEQQGFDREKLDQVYTPIGLKIGAETPEEIAVAVMAEIIQVKNQSKRLTRYSDELLTCLTDGDKSRIPKVLVTIVSRKGSAPRGVGTKMLVLENGETIDSIGGGCAEANVIQKALLMLRADGDKHNRLQLCRVDMTGADAEDEGMVCGGVIEVLLEQVR